MAFAVALTKRGRYRTKCRHLLKRKVEAVLKCISSVVSKQISLIPWKMQLVFLVLASFFAATCRGDIDADVEQQHSRRLNVTDLDYYVNTEEGRAILEKDFEGIKSGKRKPWTVAEREENLWKNRYPDLYAFDETRVQLPYENGSDYINANYLNGYHGEKEYIATQGPLPNTTNDFWAMIWHFNVTKIVMLANLLEHGESKVAKYWPDVGGVYGGVFVVKVAEIPFPKLKHVMRMFYINKPKMGLPRLVRQFHYTGWPDLGVPEDRKSVIALMQQARRYTPLGNAPIVIHCSAGVGRTGTVILMDSMMEMAKEEGMVDFPKRLDDMRMQRVDAVEKKEQYVFAHEAVNDVFNNNETAGYLSKVDDEYRKADFGALVDQFKEPFGMTGALKQRRLPILGYN